MAVRVLIPEDLVPRLAALAETAREAYRQLLREMVYPRLTAAGYTAEEVIELFRRLGLSYRRADMLEDIRAVQKRLVSRNRLRFVPRDRRPDPCRTFTRARTMVGRMVIRCQVTFRCIAGGRPYTVQDWVSVPIERVATRAELERLCVEYANRRRDEVCEWYFTQSCYCIAVDAVLGEGLIAPDLEAGLCV